MLLASIDLNKRLGADGTYSRFASWLRARQVAAVLAQEPFKPADRTPPALPGFVLAGGDGRLAVWTDEGLVPPQVSSPEPWAQKIELEWLVVLHVHLNCRTGASRTRQNGRADADGLHSGRVMSWLSRARLKRSPDSPLNVAGFLTMTATGPA